MSSSPPLLDGISESSRGENQGSEISSERNISRRIHPPELAFPRKFEKPSFRMSCKGSRVTRRNVALCELGSSPRMPSPRTTTWRERLPEMVRKYGWCRSLKLSAPRVSGDATDLPPSEDRFPYISLSRSFGDETESDIRSSNTDVRSMLRLHTGKCLNPPLASCRSSVSNWRIHRRLAQKNEHMSTIWKVLRHRSKLCRITMAHAPSPLLIDFPIGGEYRKISKSGKMFPDEPEL